MENKRGFEGKYYLIVSFILGILVLSISVYFIFNEFFTQKDLDLDVCRQSVQLRAAAPEYNTAGILEASFKDQFPLRCKTNVVEIGKNDLENAEEIIAKTMATCWATFGNGDLDIFPIGYISLSSSTCVPCARIHLTEEAKKELGDSAIDIERGLKDNIMENDYSYFEYLQNSGKKFPAFDLGSAMPFIFEGKYLIVDKDNPVKNVILSNRLTGGEYNGPPIDVSQVYLPKYFTKDSGDLIIWYGSSQLKIDYPGGFGTYFPYLFYYPSVQEGLNVVYRSGKEPELDVPRAQTQRIFVDGFAKSNIEFCEYIEGISA